MADLAADADGERRPIAKLNDLKAACYRGASNACKVEEALPIMRCTVEMVLLLSGGT